MMYNLIHSGKASMMELKEYYTLDEALKLYALIQAEGDVQSAMTEEMRNKDSRR